MEKLRQSLLENAWLVVSPSECSQELFAGLTAVNFPDAIFYQKRRLVHESIASWSLTPPLPQRSDVSTVINTSGLLATGERPASPGEPIEGAPTSDSKKPTISSARRISRGMRARSPIKVSCLSRWIGASAGSRRTS